MQREHQLGRPRERIPRPARVGAAQPIFLSRAGRRAYAVQRAAWLAAALAAASGVVLILAGRAAAGALAFALAALGALFLLGTGGRLR